ncbi:MAG: TnsD family Tn7-like transposition protein [Rhodoferax sp.]
MQTSNVNSANDLFGKATFLAWLPGETLFSLISRHHCFWGHPLASRTCEQFFGHSRSGSQHDLPSRLVHFVACTDGCFGGVEEIAKNHTLLAYYAAFVSPEELKSVIACMAGESVAHLKLRLGILTSRFRANHPLKCCDACIEEDRSTFGWPYWHVEHQYPGMWICQNHGLQLMESNLKATGVERFQWHLPAVEHFREWPTEKQRALLDAHTALQSLSRQVVDLTAAASDRGIDTSRLHEVYRAELVRREWVTQGGSFRMPVIAASFLDHVKHLRAVPELEALPTTADEAAIQLGRLLRPPRSGTHPLRHMVLINWLFGSAEAFWQAQASALNPPITLPTAVFSSDPNSEDSNKDPRRDQLIGLLTVQTQSARMAARAIGIDVGTTMSWAAQAGLPVSRRPKKLAGELRRRTIAELQNGIDKATVAANAQVSVVTITKLLLSEVGLHAAWRQAREHRARTTAREVWGQLLQTHRGVGAKFLRALEPAVYARLYRNDRAWLDSHKPDQQSLPARTGGLHVLWDERDQTLSAEIIQAVQALRKGAGARQIKLWQIYQAVPTLKAKIAALDRLPLTRRAIDQAIQRHGAESAAPDLFD